MAYESTQVSIFLLNYNSSEYTIQCVKSILNQTLSGIDFHIVIVDNGSDIAQFNSLKNTIADSKVTLIRSESNLGFFGGYNLGIKYAPTSDYYYFLNNDCVLINDVVSILYRFCEDNDNVGVCSGQMLDSSLTPVRSFNYLPTLSLRIYGNGLLRLFSPNKYPCRKTKYNTPLKVGIVSGSSMFIRKKALDKCGGLDLSYYLYCEEEEIGFAMKAAGYDVCFNPEAKFIHYFGASTKFGKYLRDKEYYISLFYYYKKNYGKLYKVANQSLLTLKFLGKSLGNIYHLKLALFLIAGANNKSSMRYTQSSNTSISIVPLGYQHPKLEAS